MISCEQLSMALDNAESLEDIRDIYISARLMIYDASIVTMKAQDKARHLLSGGDKDDFNIDAF